MLLVLFDATPFVELGDTTHHGDGRMDNLKYLVKPLTCGIYDDFC